MNNFYIVTNFLKDILKSDENVNTIVFATINQKDYYKKNIYPIVHINPTSAPMRSSAVSYFTFEIGAFDQRDISDSLTNDGDKFNGQDDVQDNLNITFEILKKLYNKLKSGDNNLNIELENATDANPYLFHDINILDGWVFSVTLRIPNEYC